MQDVVLERIGNDEVVSDTGEASVGPVHAEGSNGGEHALDVANVVLYELLLVISVTMITKTLHIRSLEYIKVIITHGDTIYFNQIFIILVVPICLILSQTGVIYSEVINFDGIIFTYYMKAYFWIFPVWMIQSEAEVQIFARNEVESVIAVQDVVYDFSA